MAALSPALVVTSTRALAVAPSATTFRQQQFSFSSGKSRNLIYQSRVSKLLSHSRTLAIKAAVKEVDATKVVPQADRVLVRLEELPEKSVGGVLLPKSAVKFEHYLCGEVLSVGKEAGSVSVGQKVLFSDLNAYEVNLGNSEKVCFVKSGDLLALVE